MLNSVFKREIFSNGFLATLLALIFMIQSNFATATSGERIRIKYVEVTGLERTQQFVIRRELPFSEGDVVSVAEIEEGLQRIRNTQLFSRVSYTLNQAASSDGSNILKIDLEERWTTIPIGKFSSGGGVSRYTLGAYDVNVLGRYLELGGQYERLGTENSGVVWLRQPRLLNQRLELFVNLWDSNHLIDSKALSLKYPPRLVES